MADRINKKRAKLWDLDVYSMGKFQCTVHYKSERIRRLSERCLMSLGASRGIR